MQFDSRLQAAGIRAAQQPAPTPPPVAQLQQAADKQRAKRRVVGSGLAAAAVLAVSIPAALSFGGSTTIQEVAVSAGTAAPAAQVAQGAPAAANGQPLAAQDDTSDDEPVRIEVRSTTDGTIALTVVEGDGAATAAADAATAAEDSFVVENRTVWVWTDGDERVVAALVEPDTFARLSGSPKPVDRLIDVLRSGDELKDLDDAEQWMNFLRDDFNPFEGGSIQIEGDDGSFSLNVDEDGSFFSFFNDDGFSVTLDGEADFKEFFDKFDSRAEDLDGQFDGLDERFDAEDFEQRMERFREHFGDTERFDIDQFLEENFEGCISIDAEQGFTFEYPKGCSTE